MDYDRTSAVPRAPKGARAFLPYRGALNFVTLLAVFFPTNSLTPHFFLRSPRFTSPES